MDREELARRFREFATFETGTSPLYQVLCSAVAGEPGVLDLLAGAEERQMRPNLLLAAVQELLLRGVDHPLAAFYPSVGGTRPPDGAGPVFAAFCREHADAVRTLVSTRTTQTNEVRRCVVLAPALALVQRWAGERPLALVEVGASAGLNLLIDRYRCDYHPGGAHLGPDDAVLRLTTDLVGAPPPAGPPLRVVSRLGLDRAPLDVRDEADVRWLRACIWPEHHDRRRRLDLAVAEARRDPPELLAGDAVDDLAGAVGRAPEGAVALVVHSATLPYLAPERRAAFASRIGELAAERDLAWVSLEWGDASPFPASPGDGPQAIFRLGLSIFDRATRSDRLLARAEPHGAWLDWTG